MKKVYLLMVMLAVFSIPLFAMPNYQNGNGTIISSTNENGIKKIVRKCEIDDIKIGDLLNKEYRDIYEDYEFKNKIGRLKDNDLIKVLEVCSIEYLEKPKNKWNNTIGELWYKILLGDVTGCICVCSDSITKYTDPYYDNRYEIIEEITNGKKWTVRKMDQRVSVWTNLNIRNNPGTENTKVIYTIRPGDTDPIQTNVDVIAMTQEKETIEGRTDYWLKIKYKDYEGWIFGGYTSVERGGPKYYLPESMVIFDLSWY